MAYKLYNSSEIFERHRHRYEFNTEYLEQFKQAGFTFTGVDETGIRYSVHILFTLYFYKINLNKKKICELKDHPFFLGT